MNKEIQIGDQFDTEGFGQVKVTDIYISPTSSERAYKIQDVQIAINTWLVEGYELTH